MGRDPPRSKPGHEVSPLPKVVSVARVPRDYQGELRIVITALPGRAKSRQGAPTARHRGSGIEPSPSLVY